MFGYKTAKVSNLLIEFDAQQEVKYPVFARLHEPATTEKQAHIDRLIARYGFSTVMRAREHNNREDHAPGDQERRQGSFSRFPCDVDGCESGHRRREVGA